jgi:hypothetical protein
MQIKRAFVVMPFSETVSEKNWTEVFEGLFKPALEECGYQCVRAQTSRGSLIASIVQGLLEANLVIADVTDRNANVFYELGVRHALRRGTIIVSQGNDHVPSDLRGYWYLSYGLRPNEVAKFKSEIKRLVASFEERPDASDSPVSDYLDREQISSSKQTNRDNVKKLGALLTEFTGNRLALQRLMETGAAQGLSVGCLRLLIQTLYVDVGPDLLKMCYELENKLDHLARGNVDPEVAVLCDIELERLYETIGEVREKISKGTFSEPSVVSMMVWSPIHTSRMSCRQISELDSRLSGSRKSQYQCPTCGLVTDTPSPCPSCRRTL